MWILMTKTYTGPAGFFEAGREFDLPDAIVEQLPKSCYKKTCAPWEKHTDKNTVALRIAEKEFMSSQAAANNLRLRAEKFSTRIDNAIQNVPTDDAEKILNLIQGMRNKGDTDKLEATRNHALLTAAASNFHLTSMAYDEAASAADAAKATVEELTPKPKEPKDETDSQTANAEEPEAAAEAKDDTDSEGQTVPAEAGK